MFERPKGGERAILVQMVADRANPEQALAEFTALARSAQADIVDVIVSTRKMPEAKYYLGLGKAQALQAAVIEHQAAVVLVNHELSPSQERNLERLLQCRVVGRSGLILDIFAQRAETFEGKLQVELAQLQHMSTRLVRGWTHLERQKGGIGLRGPGETQLETDRRLLRNRVKFITKQLEKVKRSRGQNRQARQKADLPMIALVGYTNAGKSSLFNRLTGEVKYTADQLFATLDPTMRKLVLPGSLSVILTDTVGFIQDLPHPLIDAFRATLEETQQSQLLLHVIDISDPNWQDNAQSVAAVLAEIGADKLPLIQVFNKIDVNPAWVLSCEHHELGVNVGLSAHTGVGIDQLKAAIITLLHGEMIETQVHLSADKAKLRAKLYDLGAVIGEKLDPENGWHLNLRLTQAQKDSLFLTKPNVTPM